MREKVIEIAVCKFARSRGWLAYKFSSPARRGVPDRQFIKDGQVVFVEFKAPGKHPTKLQVHEIETLKRERMEVHVIDSIDAGKRLFA